MMLCWLIVVFFFVNMFVFVVVCGVFGLLLVVGLCEFGVLLW